MVKIHFDAGHGGNDSGAVGNGFREKDITLAVCLKVEEKLNQYKDVEVFQTRTTDITQSLSEKSSIVNAKGNLDFCLSVHVNAAGGIGGEVWLQEATGKAHEYAKTIINEYCSYTGAKNRGVKTGDLHMNRQVRCNSNLIELAFIDSPSEQDINLLKDIDKMAQGIVNGLVKCFGLVKNTTNTSSSSNSTGSKTSNFINKLAPLAVADFKTSKVLPSLTIAQGILESGWGESELATKANNLFGIKADSRWTGKIYNTETKEYYNNSNTPTTINANFRAYDSWEGGVKDHSEFLQADRYSKVIGAKDYKTACEEVYKAGYATDPNYTSKLIKLIEDYKLHQYDTANTSSSTSATSSELYRVRKSWNDVSSQRGAYSVLNNAIAEAKKYSGYKVFNSKGVQVYPEVVNNTSTTKLIKSYAEKGKATVTGTSEVNVRNSYKIEENNIADTYSEGESFYYDTVYITEYKGVQYVWCSYISNSSVRRYVCSREGNNRYLTCV